jgi:hypothetical protein
MVKRNPPKPKFVSSDKDPLRFLDDAIAAPNGSKLQLTLLRGAMMARYFGLLNEKKFNVRHDRRGRPKGTTGVVHLRHKNDIAALEFMSRIHAATGESRPHTLARLTVENGGAPPMPTTARAIRRLAGRWKLRTAK